MICGVKCRHPPRPQHVSLLLVAHIASPAKFPVISFTLSQRKSYAPSGVKLPSPHDVVTQTSPLHVSFAESVPSADAEHVVTTTVVATMMLHVKGIVKDIAVDSATGAADTPLYPVTLPWTLFTVQLKSLQVSFVAV